MSEQKIKIGVVGTGYLGRVHARVLTEMPEVEVVGFVEPSDAAAGELSSKHALTRFDSIEALGEGVDCAVIASTTDSHFDAARRLMDLGCDVMIEKPITSTVEQASALIEQAERLRRVIQVGHVERFNPAVIAAEADLRAAKYVEVERLGVFVGRSLDIDVVLDLMIHDLHLLIAMFNSEVVEIRAIGVAVLTDKTDIANVRLELANGVVASLTASRVSAERVRKLRLYGADVYASLDLKEQEVKGYRITSANGAKTLQPRSWNVEKKEPLRAELQGFVKAVVERSVPLVTAEESMRALELAYRVTDAVSQAMKK